VATINESIDAENVACPKGKARRGSGVAGNKWRGDGYGRSARKRNTQSWGSRSRVSFGPLTLTLLRLPFLTPSCDANYRFPALGARRDAESSDMLPLLLTILRIGSAPALQLARLERRSFQRTLLFTRRERIQETARERLIRILANDVR
jgi:hypothetical protein